MQSRVELLPPSHFMRPPPSSFQPQQKNLTTKLVNVHMPKCTADDSRTSVPAAPSAALSPFAGESSSVPQSEGIASSNASVSLQPSLHPSSTRTQTVTKAYVKPATRRADDSAATETRHRRNETFSTACKEYQGRECPLQCSEHSSGREHGKILDDWLPRKHSGAVGSRQSAANYQQNWRTQHRFPARDTTGKVDCITTSNAHETKDYENASVKLEENAEEVLARSLARCQKIDKSLEFYADIRKRWSGPSGDQSRHKTTSNASQPAAATSSRATPHAKIGAHAQKARQSRLGLRTDRGERKTKNYKPPSVFKDGVKSDFYQKRGSENSDTVKRLGERERSRVDSQQTVRKAYGPHLNDLNSLYPERRKKESGYKSPSSSVALNSSVSASKESVPVNATPTISVVAETESKVSGERPTAPPSRPLHTKTNPHATQLSITLPSQPVQSEQHQQYTEQSELKESEQVRVKEGETEEEFNDFDSVQPDIDSEPVELLSGTFGKPVLTGARPITSPEVVATRDSSQPVIGVCKKELTSTHNDTVLARVLQAEEESRAGVCLQPNTSNDLAIAQQIHQDLNQLKEEGTGATVVPLKPRGSTRVVTLRSTGAAGRGPPGDNMTYKTNFESMRFVSDDPNYYSYGYELGKEFIVHNHNSLFLEQKEKNKNIPRKSVRQNNYTSGWDDDYRYRGFDDRGYRNLTTERFQFHERNQWVRQGGTGVVTACVRDMTRSDAILEREEMDLAFEGRKDLEEIKTALDSMTIARLTHEYVYKETHRPKDESVKPVTQCLVCLDDFHVGEPLRLMPCAHSFHRFCIDKWLEENSNCPVCKEDMVSLSGAMGVLLDHKKYKKRHW